MWRKFTKFIHECEFPAFLKGYVISIIHNYKRYGKHNLPVVKNLADIKLILICLGIYMYVMVTINIKSQAKLPLLTCLTDVEDNYFEGKKVLYNHKLVSHLRHHYRYLHSHHCNMNTVRIWWVSWNYSCPNTRKWNWC